VKQLITLDLDEEESKGGDGEISEEEILHNKKLKPVYMSEERINNLKARYDCVCVNEFGDDYHLSEDERRSNNQFYDAFKKFSKFKHKYRKLPEYIDAMREGLKCLDFVAERNGFFSKEEFKDLVAKKKIIVTGLQFPKYTGKDRKKLDWKFVNEYILSDEPSENVFGISHRYDEDVEDPVLTDEEKEIVLTPLTEEEIMAEEEYNALDQDQLIGKNIVLSLSGKNKKKFFKDNPEIFNIIKELNLEERRNYDLSSMVYGFLSEDINNIDMYDKKRNDVKVTGDDIPEFKGKLSSSADFNRYMRALEEYENTNIKYKDTQGRYISNEEREYSELRDALDRGGFNIRAFYNNAEKEKKLKKINKEAKKREAELKRRLTKIQSRRDDRLRSITGEEIGKKSKKKKSSKKIEKNKKKSKKKFEEAMKKCQSSDRITDFKWGN
jgi:hypothetical protein